MKNALYKSVALHLVVLILFLVDVPVFWRRNMTIEQVPIIVDLNNVKISEMTNLPPKAKRGPEEKQASIDYAAVKLHDAEATFSEVSARIWDNFKTTRHTIRAELEQAVRTADIVNPDAINNNAVELMKTGVMTSADYAAFVKKYGNNPTMLRLISHYSAAAAKAQDGSSEAAALNAISNACQSWKDEILQKFDDL